VSKYSFRSLEKKGKTDRDKHAFYGALRQWKDQLPQGILKAFREQYEDLLVKSGYESICDL
jgi:hypothetical protein